MNQHRKSLGRIHFIGLRGNEDPWRFHQPALSRRNTALRSKLDIHRRPAQIPRGRRCSIGESDKTARTANARRCSRSISSPDQPLRQPPRPPVPTCRGFGLARMQVPQQWPDGTFDPTWLSEAPSFFSHRRDRHGGGARASNSSAKRTASLLGQLARLSMTRAPAKRRRSCSSATGRGMAGFNPRRWGRLPPGPCSGRRHVP